jgi:uncharacterized protein YbjT (DUF2867 family)
MIAIILGATGLVGSKLLDILLADARFDKVRVLTRRTTGIEHPKLEEHIIDFDEPKSWQQLVKGDVLFSAFGTTIKTAGSKEVQYKIDHTYQYEVAKAAAENGVNTYVLISAAFSNPKSSVFYSRMKGELEHDVMQLPFAQVHILRPGILDGDRKEHRAGEKAGIALMRIVSLLPALSSMRPIKDSEVARAMITVALKKDKGIHIYSPKVLFLLAKS